MKIIVNIFYIIFYYYIYLDIDIDLIMAFNKIRAMTTNKSDLIEAVKDSKIVEFSEDFNKIRKKNLNKEFMK